MSAARSFFSAALTVILAVALSACGETPQGGSTSSKASDLPAWDAAQNGYGAAGFQRGDKAAWEQQMRTRAESQNEYTRTP